MRFPDHIYLEPDDCWDDPVEPDEEEVWDEARHHDAPREDQKTKGDQP